MEAILMMIGSTNTPFVRTGIDEYCRRLKHYIPFSILEIKDVKASSGTSREKQKQMEGEAILKRLNTSDMVILLDERGKEYTSLEFAAQFEKWQYSGKKRIIFIVGGPFGFSDDVYSRSDGKLSLSRMTFNHEMVRLFFIEQVYRAQTILRNEPYHHE
ncbi:MAG: 23S rRNA (pseudouridine(1915)-N(3))-methyltransferase RlmH [Bacteroides sp.]|nr:23S rRNA (pseudouridine(1915)-N(3))-methyltransferase RlmH [Bacteroides sp.]